MEVSVFLLFHCRNMEEQYQDEDSKLFGVFASEEKAKEAIELLINQPGFCDLPENFIISPYDMNKIEWAEGYSSSDDGDDS